jgi:hypothetical protein
MGFCNQELLKNNAKDVLQNGGVETNRNADALQKSAVFSYGTGLPSHQFVMLASTQITLNNTLKETLKYLKNRERKVKREPVLGELWQVMTTDNEQSEKNPYHGDLIDFEIDAKARNIFAA